VEGEGWITSFVLDRTRWLFSHSRWERSSRIEREGRAHTAWREELFAQELVGPSTMNGREDSTLVKKNLQKEREVNLSPFTEMAELRAVQEYVLVCARGSKLSSRRSEGKT